jgi:hypothetical protein
MVQIVPEDAGILHFLLMGIQLIDDEVACGLDDELLFIVQRKVHRQPPI